jgi:4-alpha-glucanotransferase
MKPPLDRRSAGVLLHPSSLPGPGYCGDFGDNARRFVDLLSEAGLSIWQVLPLGPTYSDWSPYQSPSVHAGNPDFIDLFWLVEQGWISAQEADQGAQGPAAKRQALSAAWAPFCRQLEQAPDSTEARAYRDFLQQSEFWLEDYARFQAFRDFHDRRHWHSWPEPLRNRDKQACDQLALELADQIELAKFRQFVFHYQWRQLREYANQCGVLLFGDMPIYLHLDSADVWSHRDQFDLDEQGMPRTVTGVPPDYFSAEGQLWGNPQYNWQHMREDGFHWWLQRFTAASKLFDVLRIDHFRGMEAYWEIPASATKATEGRWVPAPGRELLQAVQGACPELCLVAENLGIISAEVESLRRDFQLPGMVVLQFAFDGSPDNPHLPQNHSREDIVYTGTHDNDTTLGWYQSLSDNLRQAVYAQLPASQEPMPWMLVQQAMNSVANTAIVPWQDFLGLDGRHRMNTPGTTVGNWHWRFGWEQVPADLAARIRKMLVSSRR